MARKIIPFFPLLCLITLFSTCKKEYSVETGITTVDATGSLKDSSGNCIPATVAGTFYNGVTPGSDTAYVEVKVNVDTAGSYVITTDLQNGFMFADSGFFSTTGINIIKLKPIGTPILQKPTLFTVNFDTSICSFTVNVNDSTGTGLGGGGGGGINDTTNLSDTAWQFSQGVNKYNGIFDQAFVVDTLGGTYMVLIGLTAETGDTAFVLSVPTVSGVITPGTYTTLTTSVFYLQDLFTGPPAIFSANFLTAPDFITINILSYDASTKIVTGNFSGTAKDAAGNSVPISSGSFKALITN